MDENNQQEPILWEYTWSGGDLNEMNRLGREGWEAIGTNASANALVFGATYSTSISVLYKKRYFPKPPKDNEAGLKLKQIMKDRES
jgi:hypothetical protein